MCWKKAPSRRRNQRKALTHCLTHNKKKIDKKEQNPTTCSVSIQLQPPWWTGTLTRWPCRTSRLGRCGSSYVAAGWGLTAATAWPRGLSVLQRTTRSLALGWILTYYVHFWDFCKSHQFETSDSKPAFLHQEYFPDQNVHRLQGRTHLGVYSGSSLTQSVHSSPEGLLLHEPAPLHHGHQHCLLEHSCRSNVACTLFNRSFICLAVFKGRHISTSHLFYHLLSSWSPSSHFKHIHTRIHMLSLSFASSSPSQDHCRLHGRRLWWALRAVFSCFQSTSSSSPSSEASDLGLF